MGAGPRVGRPAHRMGDIQQAEHQGEPWRGWIKP